MRADESYREAVWQIAVDSESSSLPSCFIDEAIEKVIQDFNASAEEVSADLRVFIADLVKERGA